MGVLFAVAPPSRLEIETKVEFLLNGSIRAYSPAHPLSRAEKVAFVTAKNRPRLGVKYGFYPALYGKPNSVSGAEANQIAQSLFGACLPNLFGRKRVAYRSDQSMVDPFHARVAKLRPGKDGLHVRFVVHHWAGKAWDQGPDRSIGQGQALLRMGFNDHWYVAAYQARLTRN